MKNHKDQPITQKYLNKKFDDFALIVKGGFDNTATKEELKQLATKDELVAMETRLNKKINNLNEQVTHYLELSDDRYLEIKGRLKTHEQWFNLIAKKLQLEFKAQN
ncbi:MAG: hypothetical protein A3H70_04875 [Candidatus Komeilibacteria bacterium RIFCSPLOWO2_02_FULL_48_11]|uniref:Uncharacterized protein n=1 Tax=Candidatus Komeilibacteria bacterium RIFCSPLOWO2_02_FULL_48_11 TaxID=1798553 RepID=A0A1G2BRQ9_9BACT|nr:MAG: hypothetical protein A3H70_04875 [Candidatus Komeilibacteria bacterium RIFCSPLOWO2_02_FULL_48_11]